jgi:alpha-galactosidase
MLFRQDLPGFGEPASGHWDGFQRINTATKSGGIVGVFKHNAMENERTIMVKLLDPGQTYVVKKAVTGQIITSMTGEELQCKGFRLTLNEPYDATLLEVTREN